MIRLIVVTLAAMYGILWIFGDAARRPAEVARAEPLDFRLLSPSALPTAPRTQAFVSDMSDSEAVAMAIAAGKAAREERRAMAAERVVLATRETPAPSVEPEMVYRYVTGSRVNLRGGPSTSNAIVGQATFGTEAEVLADSDGWYQVRLTDGSGAGWISGQFLDAQRPG